MLMLGSRYRRNQWIWNYHGMLLAWQRRRFYDQYAAGGSGDNRRPPKKPNRKGNRA